MADPNFDIRSLEGRWYKVMGMDARYDCFDCQVNHFSPKPGQPDVMVADVQFRMPRPRYVYFCVVVSVCRLYCVHEDVRTSIA